MKKYLVLAVFTLLAGCNTISGPRSFTSGANSFFTYAAADKNFPVVVVSNSQGESKERLEALVLKGLDDRWSFLRAKFVAKNTDATTANRFVFVFNPTKEIYGNRICSAKQSDVSSVQGVTEIAAAFCEENIISVIRAKFDTAQKLGDKDFIDTIGNLTWQIVPESSKSKNYSNQ